MAKFLSKNEEELATSPLVISMSNSIFSVLSICKTENNEKVSECF